jgi:hypothetical protein
MKDLIGKYVAIEQPRVEEVNPKTRACTGKLQCFKVVDEEGHLEIATGHTPEVLLTLGGGYNLR